jgi:hypothetical protein
MFFMKKLLLLFNKQALLLGLFLISSLSWGQVTISSQDFEATPASPALTFANTGGGNSTGTNLASGLPASANLFVSGSRGWQAVGTTTTLTFANQSLSGYTSAFVDFRLAGMSVNESNGIDSGDVVTVSISVDGGTTYSSELTIAGSGANQRWAFSATGNATVTYDGNNTPTAVSSSGGSGGISTVRINIPNANTQIRVRISMTSGSNERWVIDDVRIGGTVAAVPVVTGATIEANVGVDPNYQIVASNNPNAYSTGTLPDGLSMSPTGLISGIPTTAGNFPVEVTASNSSGTSDPATLIFNIAKGNQTINFATLANSQYGDTDFNLTGTSNSGLSLNYTSSNTNVATIAGNTVTIIGVGTTDITASQSGNADYNAATNVVRTLTVTPRVLTVSGLTGVDKIYNATNTATVSGTPVLNNVLAADVANVTLTGTPTYSFANANAGVAKPITASGFSLTGSAAANYSLTQPIGLTATISQKIVSANGVVAQNKVYDATTVATITAGTLVGIEVADAANVSIATTGVFASTNVGTGIAVTVSLTGSAALNYNLTQPGVTADITKANQTINFNALPTLNTSSSSVNLNTYASATSGLALTYQSSDSNVVSISGNTLSVVGVGSAIITASQAGNLNYNAATNATQNVTVSLVPISIFSNPITGSSPGNSNPYTAGQSFNANITVTGIGRGAGILGIAGNDRYNTNSWTSGSTTLVTDDYFEFNLTPNNGYLINFEQLQLSYQSSASGPSTYAVRSSADNFANDLAVYTNANTATQINSNLSLTATAFDDVRSQITFRVYGYNAGTGAGSINEFNFIGFVTCIKPIAYAVTGGGALCGSETANINLSDSEVGMNYQLRLDGVDVGSPVAGTGNALVFGNQTALGTYTIVATNQFCSASTTMSGNAIITNGVCGTTWTITNPATEPAWTNGAPTAAIDAIIDADYDEMDAIIAKNLTVNAAAVLNVKPTQSLSIAGNLTNNGSIIFKSDATGTARFAPYTGAAIAGTGTSTVERYIPANRAWRILTAPLTGVSDNTITDNWQGTNGEGVLLFSPTATAQNGYVSGGTSPNIRKYATSWQNIADLTTEPIFGATATDTKPFLVFVTGPSNSTNIVTGADTTTLRPKGQLITGPVNHTGLATGVYHALANPYASAINPVSLITNNTGQKLWLINPSLGNFGAYVTFDGQNWSVPVDAQDAFIQSGQGFFVRSATATSFQINELDKVSGSSNNWFAKNAAGSTTTDADKIRVLLYKQIENNWKLADGALSVNYADGSNEVNAMDSNKISNFNESIMFRNNTTSLSIEHRALPVATEIQPIRLTGTTALPYQLRVRTENYSNSTLLPVLEDTVAGTFTTIPTDGSEVVIPFTGVAATTTNPDNRFRIVYQVNLNNVEQSPLVASVFPNPVTNNQLHIHLGSNNQTANYTVTNLLGQFIQKGTLANTQNVITLSSVSQGFYLLNITQDGKSFTTKIYVQ